MFVFLLPFVRELRIVGVEKRRKNSSIRSILFRLQNPHDRSLTTTACMYFDYFNDL